MKNYDHKKIEKKWHKAWEEKGTYKTLNAKQAKAKKLKPYYVLDMFPYPSGVGLHVGHPRGYIGSDVFARMKRMQGYNVLHPMGYDAFGLPAEQFAIQNKIHPRKAVEKNVKTFRSQLEKIGFSFDWDRAVNTTDPEYYKWTQWIFLQIYNSYYDVEKNKARPISELVKKFEKTDKNWKNLSEVEKQKILMNHRLAYEGFAEVNWCPEMGTVLANDEVIEKDGKLVSERGEFPVEKKSMRQWFMRITSYADRLLSGLDGIDWPENIKEIQRNWIGKSEGSEITFDIATTQKKYVIFDFDGVIGDTYHTSCLAQSISEGISYEDAVIACQAYADRKPNHSRGSSTADIAKADEWNKRYAAEIIKHDIALFDQAVSEIKKIQNMKYAVVSSGTEVYVKPMVKKAGLTPTHVLAYEDHHSKEEKIELICKDWGIDVSQVYYVTDTKADVYELGDMLGLDHIYGCVWGYCGYEKLREVLPESSILKEFSELSRVSKTESVTVFTTRADTLFGVTYVVLAPEHSLVNELKSQIKNWNEVQKYISDVKSKSDEDRVAAKEKTGVVLEGVFAVNPANGEQVPIWIADYVLATYGTGAVMAVPAHDERDFEFANKYHLPIKNVILPNVYVGSGNSSSSAFKDAEVIKQKIITGNECYAGTGSLVNSPQFEGLRCEEARKLITEFVKGKLVTKFRMRDAIFARQRYWGEPIPLIHGKDGVIAEISEKNLPLELPNVKSYEPTGTGESPLAAVKSWMSAGYETNTMPGWAGSSWYFLRYADPKNKKAFADESELDYWFNKKDGGVDMYVGGAEHATGHLLYSRFWHKFLFDLGYVKTDEPFKALRNQGMILGADNRKMGKRYGNAINPDDVVAQFGADALRVFEMFLGPFDSQLPWSTEGIIGSRRFIEKVWALQDKLGQAKNTSYKKTLHKTIKKVTDDIATFSFNTAISAMMILVNEMSKSEVLDMEDFKKFLQILAPFASHISEELWSILGGKKSIHVSGWPKYDPKLIVDDSIKMGIQVNGKVRAEIEIALDATEEDVRAMVMQIPDVTKWIEGKEVKKFIFVPKKIISIVVA